MNIEKINELCIEIYGKLAGDFEYRFVEAIEAARATAEQRDNVIEECVTACQLIGIREGYASDSVILTAQDCAKAIRALKSQQDAAIESQRSGDGS